jgi:rifamycin polyketide synthase module 1/2/3
VIKMLMAMRHGTLPRSLHLDVPSKHVDWSAGSVSLLSEPVAWEHGGRPRRAGVSSFGASGTNAHLILEQAPAEEGAAGSASDSGPHPSRLDLPFVLSAKSDGALRAQARRLHSHLQERPELAPVDVAHTLAGRSRFEHRAVVLAPTRDELLARLEAISRGAGSEGVVRGVARRERKLAFLFSGQGSQRAGMGSELYDAFPAFAERFDAICAELDPLLDLSLKQSVFQPADGAADSPLDRTQLTQPALFALEVSLYELMRSFGIVPDYLIGHSIGEIAAAHVADVFSLHDAAQLVAARGRLMGALSPQGGMLAVEASEQEALASLDGHEHHVSIAAVNSPSKVVLSGALEALEELELLWRGRARKTSRLRVSQAFHSTLMTPMLQELAEVARGLDYHAPSLPIVSNVSGTIAAEELREPEYWVSHVRETVRFADGVKTLREAGVSAFLELGPDATLSTMARECLGEEAAERSLLAPSMRPRRPEAATFLELLSGSFTQGVKVDLSPLLAGRGARPVELPTYAFQRERHWLDAADTQAAGAPTRAAIEAPDPAPAESHDSTPSSFEGALGQTLSETSESEREALVLELVRSHVAVVLGYSSPEAIDVERTFKELGLESQGALELRDRLSSATELKLAATLVYEHPSPLELARELRGKAEGLARPRAQATRSAHTDEPIAIVGMSCRLPGGVSNPDELWELLARGGDAITEFPDDRGWELERVYDPDGARPDTTYTRRGGFLDDVDGFDADFFGIAPDEALAMDPQQRLLLEGSWEALEHAGIDPASLRGSDTGVFAGVAFSGYGLGAELLPESAPYRLTGSATSLISGRAAYAFGLEGPAVSIDTACSSSLVAIHMACQALRAGECSMALAGGVTVLATPVVYVEFARSRGLSPDGRCKSFSADADGAGFSEGIGMLVLKPLSQATRDGDRVLAVIRGSAVNQDGASNGLTAHSGPSQERVIQQALANSGLNPADIDAVEAHSTGTPLGDPIEARALLATYGQGPRDRPLRLATIKSNIGHTQAAAGVAGVIKIVQALRHETLPMTLHAERPSAHVDWAEGEVDLLSAPASWPRGERPRRAGVSSFGISGTNAHLILEEPAPSPEPDRRVCPAVDSLAFVLSGNDRPALRAQAERLREHMAAHPELDLRDVAATLAVRRASLPRRAAVLARDRAELMTALDALASGRGAHDLFEGRARREGKITFIFSGRGPRTAVDRELYRAFPAFAAALDDLCTAFEPHLERPLKSMLFAPDGSTEALLLADARYGQVGLFALELALYRLIASFGVVPDYLLGHAVGELVAAHVAGVLSLEDACTLVAARGRLVSSLGDTPESVEIPAELEAIAADLTFSRPRIPVISNMSGEPLTDQEASTAAYWICTASQSMCFGDGASFLQKAGVTRLLELGPDNAALEAMAAQFTGSARGELLGCALRCPPGAGELLGFLTRAYVHGVAIDWRGLFPTEGHRQADLPTYAFQRERYWLAASSEAMGTESPSSRPQADALPVGVGEG